MPPADEENFQPLRALNDLLYCERRCALHRVEEVWVENVFTLEGTAAHGRAHAARAVAEAEGDGRVVRGMWLRCERLGLVGKADVVEFRREPGSGGEVPFPIEYKRGRRRRWNNDDVQLCAQAFCLEEMLGASVLAGAIFHVKSKRRREVRFDEPLRRRTEEAARRLHELFASGLAPPAVLKPQCRGCSLKELCLPELLSTRGRAARYARRLYVIEGDE
ncbi:MAG: CRISPR-associated protein Cas4 [Planctomycetes bacterium]|nr:CRISPR-associated protein Cas4 [Planctomycetota bacterium]